jgi:hypothetical protein
MQQFRVQFGYETACVPSINPYTKMVVDLEYFVRGLGNEGHDVVVGIDANERETHAF